MTGRHMTLRCDGNSAEHMAFGGPIFYGHAPQDNEEKDHPGNVFWEQGRAANSVFDMLDGKQRAVALVREIPREQAVAFRGASGEFPDCASPKCLRSKRPGRKSPRQTLEPYRQADRDEVAACLKSFGGLDQCSLAFYQDGDIGDDQVWTAGASKAPPSSGTSAAPPHGPRLGQRSRQRRREAECVMEGGEKKKRRNEVAQRSNVMRAGSVSARSDARIRNRRR